MSSGSSSATRIAMQSITRNSRSSLRPPPPTPRRQKSISAIASGWSASWRSLQNGSQLQTNSITEIQIGSIALGGVIGTGLFLGSATALRHAGPGGAVVGYAICGSIVFCMNKSLAHIVSCFPRSGGPVGLAHLYVDPALAFALGWMAWYNWTIVYPAEIAAASLLMNTFLQKSFTENGELITTVSEALAKKVNYGWTGAFIFLTVVANLPGTRWFGRIEASFSIMKITTITVIILICIILATIDRGDGLGRLLFTYWENPGAFPPYRSSGRLGQFFAIWSVLLQACFSFFGTEVAVMAAAEVRNPQVSIPRAAHHVWIRIVLFYVFGVFSVGLVVPHTHRFLSPDTGGDTTQVLTSPFVIAFSVDGTIYQAAWAAASLFALAAFSAAFSDVFISSRLLFFLSKCGHAPDWCSKVIEMPRNLGTVPIFGILLTGAFGCIAFMAVDKAEEVFNWLSTMTSTAALCSWIGMLVTYIKWMNELDIVEELAKSDSDAVAGAALYRDFVGTFKTRIPQKRFRAKLRAYYALIMCICILMFNGWAVFTIPDLWVMATTPDSKPPREVSDIKQPIPRFITSYLPIPVFLLLIFGYKLINRTQATTTECMVQNMTAEWTALNREEEEQRLASEQLAEDVRRRPSRSFFRQAFTVIFCWNPNA